MVEDIKKRLEQYLIVSKTDKRDRIIIGTLFQKLKEQKDKEIEKLKKEKKKIINAVMVKFGCNTTEVYTLLGIEDD